MRSLWLGLVFFVTSATAQNQYLIDWESVGEESIGHLVDLIRIDSTNPPGNETQVAEYLRDMLAADGLDSEMFALDPDRANLVSRITGNGSKRPLLIMGHTDVVGVQADNWSVDPYSGIRKDGWIWGRGSLDDKDTVAAGMMVMLLLKRFDVALDRDVIFLAEAGEEGTPEVGINFMVANHFDQIDAEFCIAEGGSGRMENGVVTYLGIQTTEKMPRRATLVARGTPGHGSRPNSNNSVSIIANAISKVDAWQTEVRLNDTTRAYFTRRAELADGDDAFRYANVENADETASIQRYFLENNPYHYSIMRTSVAPTVIDAGFRKNVIPSEASAILDIRMLPDEDVAGFYEKLAAIIDDDRIEIVPERIYRPAAPPSQIDNEMFQMIEHVTSDVFPGAAVLPTMSTGATDMAQVRAKGINAYGIGPVRTLEEATSGRGSHGDDERISEQAYLKYVEYMWSIVIEAAAATSP